MRKRIEREYGVKIGFVGSKFGGTEYYVEGVEPKRYYTTVRELEKQLRKERENVKDTRKKSF